MIWLILIVILLLLLIPIVRGRIKSLSKYLPFIGAIMLISRIGLTPFLNLIGWLMMIIPLIREIRQSSLQRDNDKPNSRRKDDYIDVTPKEEDDHDKKK
jgi:hypothetical protein